MYKQIIIARRDLNMSPGKLAAQVSHASMMFLIKRIQMSAQIVDENRYPSFDIDHPGHPAMYRRGDLYYWAKDAFDRGENYFYCRPVDPDLPYGKLELCDPNPMYVSDVCFDEAMYEEWLTGSMTKVVLGARNKNKLLEGMKNAKEHGFAEGIDFFPIYDACHTELAPEEENGSTLTCVGFKPMPSGMIDLIGKEFHLY